MKTLRITKGYWIDTEEGHQEVQHKYNDSNRFLAHNYDENGKYTGASYLTDQDILSAEHNYSGKAYGRVEFCEEEVN